MIPSEAKLKVELESTVRGHESAVSKLPALETVSLADEGIVFGSPQINHHKCEIPAPRLVKKSANRLTPDDYAQLVRGICEVVSDNLPPGSTVAVISKGDCQLVELKQSIGWHFPQEPDGKYAGFHPPDSAAAMEELERVRTKGADYLLVPITAYWWLEYYAEFGRYLETGCRKAWSDDRCLIYQISGRRASVERSTGPKPEAMLPLVETPASGIEKTSTDRELRVAIDSRIPERLVVGEGNAFYITGWCYHSAAKLAKLEVVANGSAHLMKAWGVPRPDVRAAHFPQTDSKGLSYRSGFWGFVPFHKVQHRVEAWVALRATLADGTSCERAVGRIDLEPGAQQRPMIVTENQAPLVSICMATYNPPIALFKRQIDSIRSQTYTNWVCIITDDCSRPDLFEKIRTIIGEDRRFKIYRNQKGLGFYENFERCLSLAPEEAEFVALSDHDDYWHADKLEILLSGFGPETSLVYSDTRIVDEGGREISPTYWTTRPNNFTKFGSLIMANTITGGASMFRRGLLPLILPFPERTGEAYHDHWIGAVALAVGKINYISRPLYDYVQHASNVIGHYAPARPMALLPTDFTLLRPRQTLRETLRFWERVYFSDLVRLQLMTRILELRCGNRMSSSKAAEARRIQTLGESWRNLAWLAGRAIASGGRISETVGAERPLFGAALWRHSARSQVRQRLASPGRTSPNVNDSAHAANPHGSAGVDTVREKIAPLLLKVSGKAPRRLNLLIPTIDLKYFFGGYITKFNLARRLAEDGFKVRMVIVDHCDWQPSQWREQLKKFNGLNRFFDLVEVAYAYDRSAGLEVNPEDAFIATTWWTAHIANHATRALGASRFVYLIQEYEPFTFAMGSFAALANQSYEFAHYAIFSSEMLRAYFRNSRLGVFARNEAEGDEKSIAFQNAITDVGEISREDLARRTCKRLLYYARPEAHAARNMFEVGILALTEAVEAGYFDNDWELYGIGSIGAAQRLLLCKGRYLTMLPRENQEAYRDILRAHDVGLALMYTPHPSLVPIEMASAGMVVVTTTYANKTQEELRKVSANLIAAHPTIEEIKLGLREASKRVGDYDSRVAGSRVEWARNWESAFNPTVMSKIGQYAEAGRAIDAATRMVRSL